jgi:hypothetical protein
MSTIILADVRAQHPQPSNDNCSLKQDAETGGHSANCASDTVRCSSGEYSESSDIGKMQRTFFRRHC